jgi:hypothetical protein
VIRFEVGTALILMAAAAAAAPSNNDMARCALIPAPDSRLACYDALAHRPGDKPSAAAKSTPAPAAAPVPAPAAAAPAAAAIAADPKNFGLTPAQQHISIVSSDQAGRTLVVLDSGETWSVMDNDGRISSGDAVTIKRAALGSFLMMTPSNHSYRVRRIK